MNKKIFHIKKLLFLFVILCLLGCGKQDDDKCYSFQSRTQSIHTNVTIHSCKRSYRTNQIKGNDVFEESIEKDIQQLVVATNKTLIDAKIATSDVLERISKITDTQKALKLYDLLLDLSITQQVTIKDYNRRQNWYAILWHNAMGAFIGAQRRLGNDFKYYEKLFCFFDKYTDEIVAVEKTLPSTNCQFWSISEVRKGEFLYGIKSELKTWIHLMRDLYGSELTKGFTNTQKNDLLKRFNEVELFTKIPIDHPGGRKSF